MVSVGANRREAGGGWKQEGGSILLRLPLAPSAGPQFPNQPNSITHIPASAACALPASARLLGRPLSKHSRPLPAAQVARRQAGGHWRKFTRQPPFAVQRRRLRGGAPAPALATIRAPPSSSGPSFWAPARAKGLGPPREGAREALLGPAGRVRNRPNGPRAHVAQLDAQGRRLEQNSPQTQPLSPTLTPTPSRPAQAECIQLVSIQAHRAGR